MKKFLILVAVVCMSFIDVNAADSSNTVSEVQKKSVNVRLQREAAFEKRLNLTEEQKAKAKDIRVKGHEKLKPVIEEIKAKKQEAKMVKMSRIAVQVQEERLDAIDKELKVLEKRAHDLRKQNMKEFESILTREQKKTLKQMKKEGRQRYHADHPCVRPMLTPPAFKK